MTTQAELLDRVITIAEVVVNAPPNITVSDETLRMLGYEVDDALKGIESEARAFDHDLRWLLDAVAWLKWAREAGDVKKATRWEIYARGYLAFIRGDHVTAQAAGR
jgi:hypothetical protein